MADSRSELGFFDAVARNHPESYLNNKRKHFDAFDSFKTKLNIFGLAYTLQGYAFSLKVIGVYIDFYKSKLNTALQNYNAARSQLTEESDDLAASFPENAPRLSRLAFAVVDKLPPSMRASDRRNVSMFQYANKNSLGERATPENQEKMRACLEEVNHYSKAFTSAENEFNNLRASRPHYSAPRVDKQKGIKKARLDEPKKLTTLMKMR
jgi:hypothetical protein